MYQGRPFQVGLEFEKIHQGMVFSCQLSKNIHHLILPAFQAQIALKLKVSTGLLVSMATYFYEIRVGRNEFLSTF